LALLVLLAITTSSSAYLGLGAYSLVVAARMAFVPGATRPGFVVSVVVVAMCALGFGLALVTLDAHLADKLASVAAVMTVNKHSSLSGKQRAELAQQGVQAFTASRGLGIGAGSFRSSSLVTAVIGSTGLIGAAFLAIYIVQLAKPFSRSTYRADVDGRRGAGAAAGWAALIGLAPMAFIAASPDPGLLFSLFAGLAFGWRSRPIAADRPQTRRRPALSLEGTQPEGAA
jgi:hypothetical protein